MPEWEWYDDPLTVALWIHLLFEANYKPTRWHGITLNRGDLVTTRKELAESTGLTEQQVRTRLERLESNQQITKRITNRFTIITICNYDIYQDIPSTINQQNNQQSTNNQPTNNQQITNTDHNKEINKINNIEKENIKEKESISTWKKPTLPEIQAYITEKGYNVDAEAFYAHYESNGWMVGRTHMKKWKSAVVTWQKQNQNYGKRKEDFNEDRYKCRRVPVGFAIEVPENSAF